MENEKMKESEDYKKLLGAVNVRVIPGLRLSNGPESLRT